MMGVYDKKNLILSEEMGFVELFILEELGSQEEYSKLKTSISERLIHLYENRKESSTILYDLFKKESTRSEGKTELTLSVGYDGSYNRKRIDNETFEQYIQKSSFKLFYYHLEEYDYHEVSPISTTEEYELSATGLLAAVRKFNKRVLEENIV